ncbi:hypothetical protein EF879_08615 [Micromonospora sp. HM5-17]|nr:hypothetical protein EF879_08615 [Micromonospora sp. HM5-17]
MVDTAYRQLQPSRDQVAAWNRASSMLDGHVRTLRSCRAQLAALWPPESNAASAAYLGELDRLITAAEQTSTVAANNATQINHVANAIELTRAKLKPIYEEYVSNQQRLADYQKQIEQAGVIGGAIGQSYAGELGRTVGDRVGEGLFEAFTSPPVEDGRQEALNRQAHALMAQLDGAARDGGQRVKPPPEYLPPRTERDDGREIGDGSDDRAIPPPQVDPPSHRRVSDDAGPGQIEGDVGPGQIEGDVGPGPVTVLPHQPASPPYPTDDGPSLSTVLPPTAPTPGPTPGSPPVSPPVTPQPTASGPGLGAPPIISAVPPIGGGGGGGVGAGRVPPAPPVPGGVGRPGSLGSGGVLPPGGVIGGRPGTGVGGVPPTPVGGGTPRVNPVGGVIGPPGAAGTGRAGAAGAVGGAAPVGGRRGRSDGGERDHRRWDPDNPWEVEEGVAPSIEPNRRVSRHDTGGGVIGQDR